MTRVNQLKGTQTCDVRNYMYIICIHVCQLHMDHFRLGMWTKFSLIFLKLYRYMYEKRSTVQVFTCYFHCLIKLYIVVGENYYLHYSCTVNQEIKSTMKCLEGCRQVEKYESSGLISLVSSKFILKFILQVYIRQDFII